MFFVFESLISKSKIKIKQTKKELKNSQRRLNINDLDKVIWQVDATQQYEFLKPLLDNFVNEIDTPVNLGLKFIPKSDQQNSFANIFNKISFDQDSSYNLMFTSGFKFFKQQAENSLNENVSKTQDMEVAFEIEQKVDELTKLKDLEIEKLEDEIVKKEEYLKQQRYNRSSIISVNQSKMAEIILKSICLIFTFI